MLDHALFTLLNSHHTPFWDGVMVFVSRRESWLSAYLVLILALIQAYRWRGFLMLAAVGAGVGAADYISSQAFKPWIQRLRPCHEPALARTIRLLGEYGCGGLYGFMSSHAANTMALTVFLWLTLPKRFGLYRWALVLWTVLTGYSRVYLAAHYPGDVAAGWLLGGALGWGAAWVYGRLAARWWPGAAL